MKTCMRSAILLLFTIVILMPYSPVVVAATYYFEGELKYVSNEEGVGAFYVDTHSIGDLFSGILIYEESSLSSIQMTVLHSATNPPTSQYHQATFDSENIFEDGGILQGFGEEDLGDSKYELIDFYFGATEGQLWTGDHALGYIMIEHGGWFNQFGLPDGSFEGTLTHLSAVPIPAAIWLLGSGLIGLVGFRRKLGKA